MRFIAALVRGIERVGEMTGRFVAWPALPMIPAQFVVLAMLYVFARTDLALQ